MDRMADVAVRMGRVGAHHCAVVEPVTGRFHGLVRLADLAACGGAGNRILADLSASVPPLTVKVDESDWAVATLFHEHRLREAVVLGEDGRYVGVATAESVLAWTLAELARREIRLDWAAEPVSGEAGGGADAEDERRHDILLVEDHEASRVAMEHLLQRRHHRVTAVGSVREALAAAAETRFGLVISDIGLPDGSGYELMTRLRERHGLTGIAVSGYGSRVDLERSRAAGFLLHLIKPIAAQRLDAALAAAARG